MAELTDEEHLWLGDLRKHPTGEVRLYVGSRLISGTSAMQIVANLDEIKAAAERRGAVNALREAATDHRGPVTFYCRGTAGGTARENTDVADWLRERADRIEAGDD